MPEERTNRKLAAILAADVVGYSRLMGADEAGTLAALKRHREAIFDPAVAAHNGRIVKLIGDGTIVEFGSVVDAVNCALLVQRSGAALPDANAHQPTIVLRFSDGGDISVKNIKRPIRVWKWHPGKTDVAPNRSDAANAEPKVETQSIAVLPFTNMSGDPEQEHSPVYLAEEMAEHPSQLK